MNPNAKATGWMVPLAFCLAILGIVFIASLFGQKIIIPVLPPELVRAANETHLNLDDAEGENWRELIRDSSTGFENKEIKDRKLFSVAANALKENRLDAAAAALIHIKTDKIRERAIMNIHARALNNCSDLLWSVFAIHSSHNQENINSMARELEKKWQECKKTKPH